MNTTKMFLEGFSSYKSICVAAAAFVTAAMLMWVYTAAQNAGNTAAQIHAKEHRIEVSATRLVSPVAVAPQHVATLGSGPAVR